MKSPAKVVKINQLTKLNFKIMLHFIFERVLTHGIKNFVSVTFGKEIHLDGHYYFIEHIEKNTRDGLTTRINTSKTLYKEQEYNEEIIKGIYEDCCKSYEYHGYKKVDYKKDNFIYVIK